MSGMLFDRTSEQPWSQPKVQTDRTTVVQRQGAGLVQKSPASVVSQQKPLALDFLPKAFTLPPPSRPNRPARFKMVCSFQDFFQQKASKSSSEVAYLVGQDLEFKIVDMERGGSDLFPEPGWKWTLISGEGHEGVRAGTTWKVFRGEGSYLKTNDLFPGKWTLIARNRLRDESCSMRLVGTSIDTWELFQSILPEGRIDPDAYLQRLDRCIEVDASGATCGGSADPAGPRELARKGGDPQLLRSRLEKRLEPTKGLQRIPVQALFTDLKSMLNFRLRVFLAVVDGKWHLTDWSCPEIEGYTGWFVGGKYEGGPGDKSAIRKAFDAWENGNRYPQGSVHWRVVVESEAFEVSGFFGTSGKTDIDVISEDLQYVGTGLMALQLSANPAAIAVGKVGSNLCFAASSAMRVYERWSQGFNSLHDWLQNGMDLAVVAFSILGMRSPLPKLAPKEEVVRVIGVGEMLKTLVANGKQMSMLGKIEFLGGTTMIFVCHLQAGAGILAIANRKDLTTGEKVVELTKALGLLLVQDALMFLIMRRDLSHQVHMEGGGKDGAAPNSENSSTEVSELPRNRDSGRGVESLNSSGSETRDAVLKPRPPGNSDGAGRPAGANEGKPEGVGERGHEAPESERPIDAGQGEERPPASESREGAASESEKGGEQRSEVEPELSYDEIPGAADAEKHETIVTRKKPNPRKNENRDSHPEGQGEERPMEAPPPPKPPHPPPTDILRFLEERPFVPPDVQTPEQFQNFREQVFYPWLQKAAGHLPGFRIDALKTLVICGKINGKPFFKPGKEGYEVYLLDVNQAARTRPIENPSGHTPAFEKLKSRVIRDAERKLKRKLTKIEENELIEKLENEGPNSLWGNVHGEGGALHQLGSIIDEFGKKCNFANGAEVELWIYGNKVCSHCLGALKEIASGLGIRKLTLVEQHVSEDGSASIIRSFEEIHIWTKGEDAWKSSRREK